MTLKKITDPESTKLKQKAIKRRTIGLIKKYRFAVSFALLIAALYYIKRPIGAEAFSISIANTREMLGLLPPIFIFVGLLDSWVSKETIIRYMGENSGIKGVLMALFLGSAAAGPLYVAFPIANLLLKKRAKLTYILFFLGVWSTTKLPILLYEISYMGLKFTAIQVGVSLPLFLLFSLIIEKILPEYEKEELYRKAELELN